MLFNKMKNEALNDHDFALKNMEEMYAKVMSASDKLNEKRDLACKLIEKIEHYINLMARTPKNIDRRLGEVSLEITLFKRTEEYAQEAYEAAVKSGIFVTAGATSGVGLAVISSSEWKHLTTTFGRESTDKVITYISNMGTGKTTLFKAIGNKIQRNLGKIGVGITVVTLGIGIAYVSYSNYNISNQLINETIKVDAETNHLRKILAEIESMDRKISKLVEDLKKELFHLKIISEKYGDYIALSKKSRSFLISYINNTFTLAQLLNKGIK